MGLPSNVPNPLEISEGGGLYEECWVRVTKAETTINTTYRKDKTPTPMLELTVQELEDASDKGKHTELYKAGSADNWDVSGVWFTAKQQFQGKNAALSKNNPAGELMLDINNSGFQWDMANFATQGVKQLEGHLFWVIRRPLKQQDGSDLKDQQGRTKTRPYLVRWGGNGAQPVEGGGAAPASASAPPSGGEITDADKSAVEAAVLAQLASGPQAQANVITAIVSNPPVESDKVTTLVSSGWLVHADRPWTEANGTLTKK